MIEVIEATLPQLCIIHLIALCTVNTAYKTLGMMSTYHCIAPSSFPWAHIKEKRSLNLIKLLDGDGGVLKRPQFIRLCCNNSGGYSTSDYVATIQGPFTLLIIWVMYNIPYFCVVQNSCFLCCTKFLFFSDVQYSWFQWCTILLFSVMYNIPDYNDVQYSFILRCTIFLFSM